ncbi:hypothetical protein [Leifsonia sp. SIMBA_070]|uniref:hypothetical protein n=1 Tax=Leifsonia sp. SIMBA_070 TaxID=3085810 RepID=UPI003979ED37
MVLLLGGCASAAPAVLVSPSATVTQDPTPTAIESATPAPTQNPADPSTWILGFDRVADVRVGQSLAALASAAGLVPVEDTVDCPPGYWTDPEAPPAAINISVMQEDSRGTAVPDPTFSYAQFAVREPSETVVSSSPSTDAGIRIGSTESDLLAAYPSIQKTHSRYDDSMGYTTYADGPSGGRYLVFQVAAAPSGARTVISMLSTSRNDVIDVCD